MFFSLLYSIMSEQPKAVCGLAYDCVQRLSPIVRQFDFALDWTELEAGRALYRYIHVHCTLYTVHCYMYTYMLCVFRSRSVCMTQDFACVPV